MDPKLSVTDIVSRLEEQIAHLAEREAFHASQEESHRGQRASYRVELDRLTHAATPSRPPPRPWKN